MKKNCNGCIALNLDCCMFELYNKWDYFDCPACNTKIYLAK